MGGLGSWGHPVAEKNLLSMGTEKMGAALYGFAIPALRTCPGKSGICSSCCYSNRGRYRTDKVQRLMKWRYAESKKPGFADRVVGEIFRRGIIVCRPGVSGDFYSPSYTAAWVDIAMRSPQCKFFAYSRSWRTPAIVPYLWAFAALPNAKLWLSADSDTGLPQGYPEGVRVCWLQHDATPAPPDAHLVFQVRKVRAKAGQVALPLVCSNETPGGKEAGVNCSNCQSCWR